MIKTERKDLRMTTETAAQISFLAVRWGPVAPLSAAAVVAECVRRVHETETRKRKEIKP